MSDPINDQIENVYTSMAANPVPISIITTPFKGDGLIEAIMVSSDLPHNAISTLSYMVKSPLMSLRDQNKNGTFAEYFDFEIADRESTKEYMTRFTAAFERSR